MDARVKAAALFTYSACTKLTCCLILVKATQKCMGSQWSLCSSVRAQMSSLPCPASRCSWKG